MRTSGSFRPTAETSPIPIQSQEDLHHTHKRLGLLMIDFVNLKIKSAQSFRGVHRDSLRVRIFIRMSDHTYISIYIYIIFKKIKN
jgi:hypothetical protein